MKKHNRSYKKKLTKFKKRQLSQIIVLAAFITAIAVIGFYGENLTLFDENLSLPVNTLTHRLPVNADKKTLTVPDKIIIAARKAGVDESKALAIAACESNFQPRVRNQQGSSATGIFQFVARTWFDYCEGDVKNADDNIACFVKLYPLHPDWWMCNRLIVKK